MSSVRNIIGRCVVEDLVINQSPITHHFFYRGISEYRRRGNPDQPRRTATAGGGVQCVDFGVACDDHVADMLNVSLGGWC